MKSLLWILHLPLLVLLKICVYIANAGGYVHSIFKAWAKFKNRPDDVFICSYPKSGTTWVQFIVHQLLSKGEINFEHINQVVYGYEEEMLPKDIPLEILKSPRLFKTHLYYRYLPKKSKYIYVARNGLDVAVSYYHHHKNYLKYTGTFDEFFPIFMKGQVLFGDWFTHIKKWAPKRKLDNVLWVQFEELKENPETVIRGIAEFLGVEIDEETMNKVLSNTQFSFMKENQHLFDLGEWARMTRTGHIEANQFIRKGNVRDREDLVKPEHTQAYQQHFDRTLANLDVDDYRD